MNFICPTQRRCMQRLYIRLRTTNMIRTRIAPTPSGFLHQGNLYAFVLTWLIARTSPTGGCVHLRLDDIDAARCRPEYVADIFDTLLWLGLDWDSGAQNPADFYQNHSQQLFLSDYLPPAEYLLAQGQAFLCTCSRSDLAKTPCTCAQKQADIALSQAAAYRFDSQKAGGTDNFVLKGKNGAPAYILVSVLEDVRHDINFIVRGRDLLPTTEAQILLAQAAGNYMLAGRNISQFVQTRFLHHGLLLADDGSKLSKSAGATAIQDLRKKYNRSDFFRFLSHNLSLPICDNLVDLRRHFDLSRFLSSNISDKLDHTF
jgi:glutamyl/glutaminyl-tRNA synthetase